MGEGVPAGSAGTISAGCAPPLISSQTRLRGLSWIANVRSKSVMAGMPRIIPSCQRIEFEHFGALVSQRRRISWRARPLMPGAISMGIARESSSEVRMELLSSRLTTICTAAPLLFLEDAAHGRAGFIPHGCCAWRVCEKMRHFEREL